MAHFAKLDTDYIVTEVIVVNNSELLDEFGIEQEVIGREFCKKLFGGMWVQTSYNRSFRKNFAGIGFKFDTSRNAFIPPQPFASWILNENTCNWEAPIPYPTDGKKYQWNESTVEWEEITL